MKSIRWIGWVAVFAVMVLVVAAGASACSHKVIPATVTLTTSVPATDLSPPVCVVVVANSAICGDTVLAGSSGNSYWFVNAANTRDGAKENGSVTGTATPSARDCLIVCQNDLNTGVPRSSCGRTILGSVSGGSKEDAGVALQMRHGPYEMSLTAENVRVSTATARSARDCTMSNLVNASVNNCATEDLPGVSALVPSGKMIKTNGYAAADITKLTQSAINLESTRVSVTKSARDLVHRFSSVVSTDGNYLGGGSDGFCGAGSDGTFRAPRDLLSHPDDVNFANPSRATSTDKNGVVTAIKPARDCVIAKIIWQSRDVQTGTTKSSAQAPAVAIIEMNTIAIRPTSKTARWA